ncbi:acetamidase (plasmid) [Sphingomonas changnyeongensis]|uniref:Acetamidase n=1 Tax=Sphingomonas changnyeongensis TaxID=2698679 RepID=A0A7Z2NYB5_9SPHN|nr:acetamidase/formamidase family protein [Sphingomonas changnyeongensis]QHL92017.1 acetamidase [Sphingomonas changnyeongensis]
MSTIHRVLLILAAAVSALVVPAAAATAETWILRTDLWGNPAFSTLTLERGSKGVTGDIDGDRIEGRMTHDRMTITATDGQGRVSTYRLRLRGSALTGTADMPDTNDPGARASHGVTGWRVPDGSGGPRTIDFLPTDYSNTWNADRRPVLVVRPGDTIHTTTIDSGGVDEHGKTRALFGNPQTGPFFVAGAQPGDTLVVHIRRLKLNRDWAASLDMVVGRALGTALVPEAGKLGRPVKWLLDRTAGRARPEIAEGALSNYSVPIKPMLGGLAVAPGFGMPAISTGDTGRFGGNMDFNEVVEGNIVYLPVQQPGALLYFGDAHALQGDGETTQYALETSMDVTVTVDVIKGRQVSMPRVESPTQIMVLGQAGSLDEALKAASTGMIQWLQEEYGLTLSQAAQVLGTAMHYSVANLAGRSVGIAARIDKALLPTRR